MSSGATVLLDDSIDRALATTVGLPSLVVRDGGALVLRCITCMIIVSLMAPPELRWKSFLMGLCFLIPGGLIMHGAGVVYDYRYRRDLGERYGLKVRWGSDRTQVRRVVVVHPPPNLPELAAQALRQIHPSVEITQGENTIECRRGTDPSPGATSGVPSSVSVRFLGGTPDEILEIRGRSGGWNAIVRWMWPTSYDFGRSIENVEEFQLALKRLVEGDHQEVMKGASK